MLYVIWFAVLNDLVKIVNTDMYTSLVGLENLPRTLKKAIDDLDSHINIQERKLHVVNRYINRFKTEHDRAMENIQNYLENPIKAFTLIKQLTSDLDNLNIIIKTGTVTKFVELTQSNKCKTSIVYLFWLYLMYFIILKSWTKTQNSLRYPQQKDLIGSVAAIARLQKTYKLTVKDLSQGNLSNTVYRTPMTVSDCYVLGQILLNKDIDINEALLWMMASLHKYNTEENIYSFTEVDIIQYISKIYHMLGDKKNALQWMQNLVDRHPQNLKVRIKLAHYEKSITDHKTKKKMGNRIKDRPKKPNKNTNIEKELEIYQALCRGDLVLPIKTSSRLSCRYLREHHAFLKMAPIKMELMYLNPDIILFHEILSESEMELIKEIAKPRLNRSKAHDPKTGNSYFVEHRISKYTWILDTEHDTIARISLRVMHMTNLNIARAEPLQVVNYGIAGHFAPHCDFPPLWSPVRKDVRYAKTGGDRIATVIFYLSDVERGGATVFPELGVRVTPVKGAAIYWPNFNGAGELDTATLHAGCPVLLGSKWVCNKWIHQYGQDDFKPCKPGYQKDRKIPYPVTKISRDRRLFEEYKTHKTVKINKATSTN